MKHILFTFSFSNYTFFCSSCKTKWIISQSQQPLRQAQRLPLDLQLFRKAILDEMGSITTLQVRRFIIFYDWVIIFLKWETIFYDGLYIGLSSILFFTMGNHIFFAVKHLWGIAKWCQMDHQETWRCFWGSLVLAPRSYRELTKSYQSFPTFLHVFTVINPGFCTKQNTSWSSWCFQIIWFKLPDSNISNAPLCITFAAEQEQRSHQVL